MLKFKPNKRHLREVLLFAFNKKKSAAEARRMIVETYGESSISERTCREWFQRYKNGDFCVENKERTGPAKKFEDAELEALLVEDPCQSQKELAESLGVSQQVISHRLKAMGMIKKKIGFNHRSRSVSREEDSDKQPLGLPSTGAIRKCSSSDSPPSS